MLTSRYCDYSILQIRKQKPGELEGLTDGIILLKRQKSPCKGVTLVHKRDNLHSTEPDLGRMGWRQVNLQVWKQETERVLLIASNLSVNQDGRVFVQQEMEWQTGGFEAPKRCHIDPTKNKRECSSVKTIQERSRRLGVESAMEILEDFRSKPNGSGVQGRTGVSKRCPTI